MQQYNTLIEDAAKLIADELWKRHRAAIVEAGGSCDRLVLELVRAVGCRALERFFGEVVESELDTTDDYLSRVDDGEFCTVLGTVNVVLPRLRCRRTRQQRSPLKTLFGVVRGGKSASVRRALTDFGAEQSYAKAVQQYQEHHRVDIGRTSALRVVTAEGERAEKFVRSRLAEAEKDYDKPPVTRPACEEIFVQLDGSMIRTATMKTAGIIGRNDVPRHKKRSGKSSGKKSASDSPTDLESLSARARARD